jgi:hypothetical protein
MRKAAFALLLVVMVLTLASVACGGGPEWDAWQRDVLQRQQAGLPTSTVEVEND